MFHSVTHGTITFEKTVELIMKYMDDVSSARYSFIIGTDSTGNNSGQDIDYITAILVHRIGFGGIYFWHKRPGIGHSLYDRVFRESAMSLEFASAFLDELKKRNAHNFSFEIHVDCGNNGKTKEIIAQVVGMIKSSGYKVVTKPDSYVASKVADRYT